MKKRWGGLSWFPAVPQSHNPQPIPARHRINTPDPELVKPPNPSRARHCNQVVNMVSATHLGAQHPHGAMKHLCTGRCLGERAAQQKLRTPQQLPGVHIQGRGRRCTRCFVNSSENRSRDGHKTGASQSAEHSTIQPRAVTSSQLGPKDGA